jgi:predicted TIM-barrel fold metal-dependent hydrolase
LLYASDYPHWDADDIDYVAARLHKRWHRKVFYDNAVSFYGWDARLLEPARERFATVIRPT